jgi:hypothetical protein
VKELDVIVQFDGRDIKVQSDLWRAVSNTPVGKDVQVVVIRAGHEQTITVKVGTKVVGVGAMAAGTCDRSGSALGYDNFNAAAAAALQFCASGITLLGAPPGRSCKPILAIQSNCGAFAVDGTCHARGWANGSEKRLAEEGALAACAKQGGRDCKVIDTLCDTD